MTLQETNMACNHDRLYVKPNNVQIRPDSSIVV